MQNIDESKRMLEARRFSIGTISARSAAGRKARALDTALLSLNAMDCICKGMYDAAAKIIKEIKFQDETFVE